VPHRSAKRVGGTNGCALSFGSASQSA
jgi:hypothetical protein